MDREQARQTIKENWEPILQSITSKAPQRMNGHNTYVCPFCGHGTREHKAGICINPRSKNKGGLKCFSCDFTGDIIDLYCKEYGVDHNTALNALAARLNIIIDPWTKEDSDRIEAGMKEHFKKTPAQDPNPEDDIEDYQGEDYLINFSAEVKAAHEALKKNPQAMKHFTDRGLSPEIIDAYMLGYDPEGYNHFLKAYPEHQTKSKKAGLYNFILPYPAANGSYQYFVSEIADRTQIDEYNGKYRKISTGDTALKAQIFNERYLKEAPEVVFICEGVYDALSVESAGGKALAFVGTAHRRFLSLCKAYRPKTHFIISLDNDGAGQKAIDRVKDGLDILQIPYTVKTAEEAKDFNEALQKDKTKFMQFVKETEEEALKDPDGKKADYLKNSAAGYLSAFRKHIDDSRENRTQPTGFSNLDRILDGGLKPGLYFIGAISSLGKTTLALQLADNIATQGRDVLIFSLEMGKDELIAKSISRLTFLKAPTENQAKTSNGILEGARYKNYTQAELDLIDEACADYAEYGQRVFIHEGVGNLGVKEIREKIQNHIEMTDNRPVVFVDYLQILAPYNERSTDKQNTDKSVLELRRIARDFNIPVIGISSFNRTSYGSGSSGKVSMSDFKESGAIEYGADVLIGLEFAAAGDNYDEKKEKAKDPREIRLVILKNRNFKAWADVTFKYHQKFNCFVEANIDAENVKTYDYDDTIEGDDFKPLGTKKGGKRDKKRQRLEEAYNKAKEEADIVGEPVTLYALAEAMDLTQNTVKAMIKELGGFSIEKDGEIQVSGEVDTKATVTHL